MTNNIVKLRDGALVNIWTDIDSLAYENDYLANDVTYSVELTFNNGNTIRYYVDDGIEETKMMTFFARDFDGMTIKELGTAFANFLYDYTGVYPDVDFIGI